MKKRPTYREELAHLRDKRVRVVTGSCRGETGTLVQTGEGWFVELTSEGPWVAVSSVDDVECLGNIPPASDS